ncbi:DUF402 domain-containing protein [Effusibacillus pohliae]|uniref:DUF402 domain-containing protein n=1 Tax=Effusibacillus pohliae TaxID=232270 RepID=UPI00035E106C|nr:DUF402 domain-containing protein [Effusibacillus pohliae]
MRKVTILTTKHNRAKHRSWDAAWVIEERPLRLLIPAQTPVREQDGSVWTSDYEVEAYFHPEQWYNAFILKKPEGTEWYCNVAAPPEFDAGAGQVRFVDYDLDVYVEADGSPHVLDREEFAENARKMGYPPETVRQAEAGLQALLQAIRERRPPFDSLE